MARTGTIDRQTSETNIQLKIDLDGQGQSEIATGVGFLDHMLTLFAKHAVVDLTVHAQGDLEIDQHHTVEDVGICFGASDSTSGRRQARHPPVWTFHTTNGRDLGDRRDRSEWSALPGL